MDQNASEHEAVYLFLKLQGAPQTIERFRVAHGEWGIKRLGAGPAQATSTTSLTKGCGNSDLQAGVVDWKREIRLHTHRVKQR